MVDKVPPQPPVQGGSPGSPAPKTSHHIKIAYIAGAVVIGLLIFLVLHG